ncbi:MLF1-adaptor molecule [Intoshia linei]|uniref:MLF1-adaptor molecule n=1 Tax=Intoshia linei TaxID=1819745 RepID=A0A177B928_9BILA|nr:MLF1-adaptor molecule [Intoshia linei]
MVAEKWKGDTSDSDSTEIVETSPCGRYKKRKVILEQRTIPGCDTVSLAMDSEDGVEVVWHEIALTEKNNRLNKYRQNKSYFDALLEVRHPNIIGLYNHWVIEPSKNQNGKVIFITEYMTCGSLKQLLIERRNRSDENNTFNYSWCRWNSQLLSALNYMYNHPQKLIHGHLSQDSIFFHYNGLIKIGCVNLDKLNGFKRIDATSEGEEIRILEVVKQKYKLYTDPEVALKTKQKSHLSDIYSFGIISLEIARNDLIRPKDYLNRIISANVSNSSKNSSPANTVEKTDNLPSLGKELASLTSIMSEADALNLIIKSDFELIHSTLDTIQDKTQHHFINCCIKNSTKRSTARKLLNHKAIREIHSLKLLTAHAYVNYTTDLDDITPTFVKIEKFIFKKNESIAQLKERISKILPDSKSKVDDRNNAHSLNKFVQSVKQGYYPLTAFAPISTCAIVNNKKGVIRYDAETRHSSLYSVKLFQNDKNDWEIIVVFEMQDKIHRLLHSQLHPDASGRTLALELVQLGFINDNDVDQISQNLDECLKKLTQPWDLTTPHFRN